LKSQISEKEAKEEVKAKETKAKDK
jgi:hypothetical protein